MLTNTSGIERKDNFNKIVISEKVIDSCARAARCLHYHLNF